MTASPTLRRRMTSMDASFLYFEKPQTPLHIGSTATLDGELSLEALVSHMESRIHRIPRYRELAVFDPLNLAHPRWEDDPDFDVKRHITQVVMPKGNSYADLLQAIANEHAKMLPRDRPLWRMILFQGLPGGRSAACSLVHHCMVDGVSGMELLGAITDLERDVEPDPPRPFAPARAAGLFERMSDAWRDNLSAAAEASTEALRWALDPQQQAKDAQAVMSAFISAAPSMLQPAPTTHFNRAVSGERNYVVLATPFGEIRGVRGALGGTINDVVLTTLSGGLGTYLRAHGTQTAGMQLRAMVPVNVRNDADKSALGNQVSLLIAPLPVRIEDAAERHQAVMGGMGKLKESNQAGGFALLSRLAERIPPQAQALAGLFAPQGQTLFNLVCTNVPGPQIPLYMAGREVQELWPLVPLSMGLGMNVCLASYNGVLYWGVCGDPKLVPDIAKFGGALKDSFEELKTAAMATAGAA